MKHTAYCDRGQSLNPGHCFCPVGPDVSEVDALKREVEKSHFSLTCMSNEIEAKDAKIAHLEESLGNHIVLKNDAIAEALRCHAEIARLHHALGKMPHDATCNLWAIAGPHVCNCSKSALSDKKGA